MNSSNIEDLYPLSPMQQGMFFHSLYAPESGTYFEQTRCTLHGDLDVTAFARAWQHIVDRQPILRTAFVWEEVDQPLQVVYRQVPLPIYQHDWRDLSPADRAARLDEFVQADRAHGFDLSQAPLMRLALMQAGPRDHHFVWSHHHLLLDGWSVPLLFKEVFTAYEAFRAGYDPHLPPAPRYRDYIAWLQQQDRAQAEAFWRRTLSTFTAPTPLMVDQPTDQSVGYPVSRLQLPASISYDLQALARQHHLTLNTIVQGAWALLLQRYSGEDDVVFGATVSGRPPDLPEAENIIGLFINTLPVRVSVTPDTPVIDWLKQLQAQQVELRQYEYSPLVEVQGWSAVPPGTALFDSILVFENYPVDESMRQLGGSLEIRDVQSYARTNYPLTVVAALGDTLTLDIAHDRSRFDAATIDRMLKHLQTLFAGIAADPAQPLSQVPMLAEAERQQLLVEWNNTAADQPLDQTVAQVFETHVERTSDGSAVVFNEQTLTYRELNQRANQLAHYLQKLNVGPDTLVAICVERSLEMIVGALGVLKAGGAYVPIDPSYPPDRIAFMLDDSQASLLLTQARLTDPASCLLPPASCKVICLDTDWSAIALESDANPIGLATPDDLAYVIYTSGSTGKPKGVLLHQRGLINFVRAMQRDFAITPDSRVLQFASFSFDASAAEIFGALLSGATLIMAERDTLMSAPDLIHLLREQAVTTTTLPPSLLNVLPSDDLPALQTVASVGEACPVAVAARWCQGRRFLNGYGPTETTIGACWGVIDRIEPAAATVPIGRPILNTCLYVLDAQRHPVPIGVPGELYIGGVGVARGYLNRPELTAEKFIDDPFSPAAAFRDGGGREGAARRLYKTGDLVRYRPDGQLEFLGRLDQQVKIRGFRIELGEIEAALTQHPGVRECAVNVHADETGDQFLIAYFVTDRAVVIDEVRDQLKARLPVYMLPSVFVMLDQLPRLPNGKVNRRALPPPDRVEQRDEFVAPRTPTEELVCAIFAEVLHAPRVSRTDHFFELGGHSLLATQAVSRLRETFQIDLPLRDLFEAPTAAQLAERIERQRHVGETRLPPIQPVPSDQPLPLSFAQQRLWFLDQLAPGNMYNLPMALRLRGILDVNALERSLNAIVQRHAALRTTFALVTGQPVQIITPELKIALPLIDLRRWPETGRDAEARRLMRDEAQQPFDLAHGPLLRARLIQLADDEYLALLTLHHSVSDGWSMGVLIKEMAALYQAFTADRPSPLPDLPIQYADFAHWQRQWLTGDVLEEQLNYWKKQLAQSAPRLELPTDRPRPALQTANGATAQFALPPELSTSINALSRTENVTLFMTLLAAFETLLHRYTGQSDFNIGTPIANRTRGELEGLIGFFVNTLVVRADLAGNPSFRDLLKRVRETALGAYAHQDLPFEMLVETLQPQRALSHTPLFQVMFVLDTPPEARLQLPDLTLEGLAVHSGAASFDLTLSMSDSAEGLRGYVEYNTDLFDATTIERLLKHFQVLLESAVTDPDHPITDLPMLTEVERRQMLIDWNQTAADFPHDRCIHDLFEAQVAQRPAALALIFEDQTLTYRDLDRRANQLARYLQHRGVGPDIIVGLSTERGPDMIVGILGILKAGGAYLPLDPYYPSERIAFMLEDSQVSLVLTQQSVAERLFNQQHLHRAADAVQVSAIRNPQFICLDADWPTIAQLPHTPVGSTTTPDHLAYVIYTSGSTGKPKGTLLQHRGLCNLATWQQRAFGIVEGSRVLQFSPFSFDASVWETFMALRNGGTLVLARQEFLAGPDLVKVLRDDHVTHVTLPPSVLNVLPPDDLPDLKVVIAAGEACPRELVQRWARGRDFFNAYGPTETTVCASMYHCDLNDEAAPPIGTPIANAQLYVLDPNLQPTPIGVPGELHVGGVSVARGYLNRPDMTAAKFIADPFSSPVAVFRDGGGREGAVRRLYKTGDLVRYRPDGNLEFLGRIDQQVKVRGFRIELGEIEAALRQHPTIRESAVLAHDNRLIAYLVPRDEVQPESGELKIFLKQHLPDYMIPALFIPLAALPLSPSGKVDRKALPFPETLPLDRERECVPPRTETEAKLAAIAAELLSIDRVGVTDNFFDLGGHSLLATQFVSRVRDTFQIDLPLRTLFEHPAIAELAIDIEQLQAASIATVTAPAIKPIERSSRRIKRTDLAKGDGNGQHAEEPEPMKVA